MANIRKTFNFREGVKVDDSVLVVAGTRVPLKLTNLSDSIYPSIKIDIAGPIA